jgi:hypothetical protein
MPRTYVSLIQADFGRSRHGNFEAVLVQGDNCGTGSATILTTTSARGFPGHASPANATT